MRWSVVLEADGDRMMTREEIVELADAVAAYDGIASGIGTTALWRAARRRGRDPRRVRCERATASLHAGSVAGRPARRGRSTAVGLISRGRRTRSTPDDPARLAGRATRSRGRGCSAGWTPPAGPAVYAIMYKPEPEAKPDTLRRDLRRARRRPVGRAVPVPAPASAVLDPTRRQPVEGLHLHLRRARRPALTPRADRPGAGRDLPPELQRAAVRQVLEGRVDRRVHRARPPARSPPTATRPTGPRASTRPRRPGQ